eukprot:999435-Rhodomonas_salina.1
MLNFEVLKALALLCKSKEKERGFVAVLSRSGYLVGRSDRPAICTDSRGEVIMWSYSGHRDSIQMLFDFGSHPLKNTFLPTV